MLFSRVINHFRKRKGVGKVQEKTQVKEKRDVAISFQKEK